MTTLSMRDDSRRARLAAACAFAGCTPHQRDAVLLRVDGASIREIGDALALPYPTARACVAKGRERLERAYGSRLRQHLHWVRDLLTCLRNFRYSRPAPVYVYSPVPGGYDELPALAHARPHGSVAEDLVADDRDFLQAVLNSLS